MTRDVTLRLRRESAEDRFDRLRRIRWWDQEKLAGAQVLVVGAGALGNEIVKNLALLGVGSILVADMDRIVRSNLSRSVLFRERDEGAPKAEVAAAAAREIYPSLRIQAFTGDAIYDLGLGVYAWADVVIGGLDNREARLHVSRCCSKTRTPFVDGATEILQGVVRVFRPPDGPCFACTLGEKDWEALAERRGCGGLRADDVRELPVPTTPTTSSIVAALECQEALKILHGLDSLDGSGFVFNGLTLDAYVVKYSADPDCAGHEALDTVISLEGTAQSTTLGTLLAEARARLGQRASIEFDHEIALSFACYTCGTVEAVFRPVGRLSERDARCPGCSVPRSMDTALSVFGSESYLERSLSDFGVAPYGVVTARAGDENVGFLLAGDAPAVLGRLVVPGEELRL